VDEELVEEKLMDEIMADDEREATAEEKPLEA
jgi:hypothetical protein